MSQTPDPTDAKADGNFGSAGSHRTGYTNNKLANAEYWARKGGTLNAGEGLVLCAEIDRLRSILSALRGPSKSVMKAIQDTIYEELGIEYWENNTRRIMYYAIEAAEKEASA